MSTASLIDLFFSFDGRISRATWWMAFVALIVIQFSIGPHIDPDYYRFDEDRPVTPNFGGLLWSLAICIPSLAVTFKRLNDRNMPRLVSVLVAATAVIFLIGEYFGYFLDVEPQLTFESIAFWIIALFQLVVLVDNAFFRGTIGPNRYGADPLDGI